MFIGDRFLPGKYADEGDRIADVPAGGRSGEPDWPGRLQCNFCVTQVDLVSSLVLPRVPGLQGPH